MMGSIIFPENEKLRRKAYCLLLGIKVKTPLSNDELLKICIDRGYLYMVKGDK